MLRATAAACAKVADPRLVPSLAGLLDPRYNDVRWHATEALRKIDTDEAASVLWPHLAQEAARRVIGPRLTYAALTGADLKVATT